MLQSGVDIRSIQELLGHKSVETMMIFARRGGNEQEQGSQPIGLDM